MKARTQVAMAIAMALSASSAIAQQAEKDEPLEVVTVVGQRAMLSNALARQQAADTIKSVITSDAIGNLPDQNVAEAVRRLAGVNVLNDQGEGRFISVRGLDPSLNAASVNGTRLPSPESDTRSVALDVIASELVESIEVLKSLTPDLDADTIGANIRINTIKAFDKDNQFIKASLSGSHSDLSEETTPEFTFDFSQVLSDKVGIAGGFSYSERDFSTDNLEMEGWDQTDDGILYADAVEYRDYDVLRERTGLTLTLDFKASDNTTLFARTLYSQFDDTEKRRRLVIEMDEEPSSGTATSATFLSDDGEISVRRGLKDRFESQSIQTFEFGGETLTKGWKLDYKASFATAEEEEKDTQIPRAFAMILMKQASWALPLITPTWTSLPIKLPMARPRFLTRQPTHLIKLNWLMVKLKMTKPALNLMPSALLLIKVASSRLKPVRNYANAKSHLTFILRSTMSLMATIPLPMWRVRKPTGYLTSIHCQI